MTRTLLLAALLAVAPSCDSSSGGGGDLESFADVTVKDCQGNDVDLLAQFATVDVTYLTFAARWCQACKEEVPRVNEEIADHFDPTRAQAIQLLVEDLPPDPPTLELCTQWSADLDAHFPILADVDRATVPVYFGEQVPQLPFHMIITRDGLIRWELLGPLPQNIQELVGAWVSE